MSQNYITLSRLEITGRIDDQTPYCVLAEIGDAHGVNYDYAQFNNPNYIRNFIDSINTTDIVAVRPPYEHRQCQYIVRFINNRCEWRRQVLEEAFIFLQRYMGNNYSLPSDPNFRYGLQTPTSTSSLNACVLYKLCRHYGITVSRDITIEQMATAIRLLLQPVVVIRNLVTERSLRAEKALLINMLLRTPQFSEININTLNMDEGHHANDPVTYDILDTTQRHLREPGRAWKRILPESNNEAVVLAAINYKIDLTHANNPLFEYQLLANSPYIPSDEHLRRILQRNRNYLRLDINFNPILPPSLYLEEDLRVMALNEGYLAADFATATIYELLQVAYVSNTFYSGWYPTISNAGTLFSGDEILELDDNVIICYGCRNEQLTALRYSELTMAFQTAHNFVNPLVRNGFFEPISIRKLKIMTSHPRPGESIQASQERHQLYTTILETEIFNDINNERARELRTVYLAADAQIQQRMQQALTYLFEMAVYMRGWMGPRTDYPIERAPSDPAQQHVVDQNVTTAIQRFEGECYELGDPGRLILRLPLLRYQSEHPGLRPGEFTASADSNQGLTIQDRITIVKEGDSSRNTNSCIRLSSNWFAASAYRYMQVVGMVPPFRIENLRSIV